MKRFYFFEKSSTYVRRSGSYKKVLSIITIVDDKITKLGEVEFNTAATCGDYGEVVKFLVANGEIEKNKDYPYYYYGGTDGYTIQEIY